MVKNLLYVLGVLQVALLIPVDGSSVCGSPQVTDRIVGGTDTVQGEWPWQVLFLYIQDGVIFYHKCGGSLISSKWVLTAAHCIDRGLSPEDYGVLLGAHKLSHDFNFESIRSLRRIIIHPEYPGIGKSKGDIALLELSVPVNYTTYIMPICLPSSSVTFPCAMECWVTGWGPINSGVSLPFPMTLQKVMLPLIDHRTCDSMYHVNSETSSSVTIKDTMICAGYSRGGKGPCQSDSGGPLVCKVNGAWYQAGVVSWGEGCALPDRPGVYTLVTAYQSWIQTYVPELSFHHLTNITQPSAKCSGNMNVSCYMLTLLIITVSLAARS